SSQKKVCVAAGISASLHYNKPFIHKQQIKLLVGQLEDASGLIFEYVLPLSSPRDGNEKIFNFASMCF
ncbi:Hypothetical predicted protein, partial [Mytilus galloprovincialis]